jgi:hypothetical protein
VERNARGLFSIAAKLEMIAGIVPIGGMNNKEVG